MNKDSLKAKAKNVAQKYNLDSRYIIQYVMFESLIRRISISKYKENIIIKGGFLLSSIFGFNQRSTMDMDATLKGMNLNKENVLNIIKDIIAIDINDGVRYEIFSIKDIRLEKKYPGFRIHLIAYLEDLRTHLMIDITTGDVITLKEIDKENEKICLFIDELLKFSKVIEAIENTNNIEGLRNILKYFIIIPTIIPSAIGKNGVIIIHTKDIR